MRAHTLKEVPNMEGCCYCTVCQGFEGSLPTECPGEGMPGKVADRVYAGVLDFRDGGWHNLNQTGLVIRLPMHYFLGNPLLRKREDHSLSYEPIPLSAVERWGDSSDGV